MDYKQSGKTKQLKYFSVLKKIIVENKMAANRSIKKTENRGIPMNMNSTNKMRIHIKTRPFVRNCNS